ncbi:hypothetical protein MY10362_004767 [Beauveria mimosiformis]
MSSPASNTLKESAPDQTPAHGTPSVSDVPLLDYDASTVGSPFSSVVQSESDPSFQTALNPEAEWFNFGSDLQFGPNSACIASPSPPQAFFNEYLSPPPVFPLFPATVPPYDTLPLGVTTTADDLRLILLGICSRLDALERAVTSANVQANRLAVEIAAVQEKPGPEAAIDGLKATIKEFTSALVLQVLSGEAPTEGRMDS